MNDPIFCLVLVFFLTVLKKMTYHPERGVMPVHGTDGVNCRNGAILVSRRRCLV